MDFAAVMADKEEWPAHLCPDTLSACQRSWLRISGFNGMLTGIPHRSGPHPDQPGVELMLPLAWPTWALAVGRKALDQDATQYPDPKPLEIARVRPALPFDGDERALFVARVTTSTITLDFFGLGGILSDEERQALAKTDREALSDGPVYVLGRRSTAILRGTDVGISTNNTDRIMRTLASARTWWAKFDGVRVGVGGRHRGDGERWRSDEEAMTDINRELRRDSRQSVLGLSVKLGVDRSSIYRRIRSATKSAALPKGMSFSEYISSREFTQQGGQ